MAGKAQLCSKVSATCDLYKKSEGFEEGERMLLKTFYLIMYVRMKGGRHVLA